LEDAGSNPAGLPLSFVSAAYGSEVTMPEGVHGMAFLLRNDLTQWHRIRTTAVPAGMVEAATAARTAGDWRGAAVAARADVGAVRRTGRRC
jgi:hypothetical protein